jgi:hypothetical protein
MKYRAYGLVLESDVEFPELVGANEDDAAAITVRLACERRSLATPSAWFFDEDGIRAARVEGGFLYDFFGACFFRLNASATAIELERCDESVGPALARHFLLDHVLPRGFNLRGAEVVHATSVLTPAGLCAFVGPSGIGKSTLAASFGQAGHPVVTDDCLILHRAGDRFFGTPGYPGVRLLGDATAAIFGEDIPRTALSDEHEKQRIILPSGIAPPGAPQPLARVYVLHRLPAGASPTIVPLSRLEAFIGLVRDNTLRFDPHDRGALLRELEFFEALVSSRSVAVRSCGIPEGLASLPAVRRAILEDLVG